MAPRPRQATEIAARIGRGRRDAPGIQPLREATPLLVEYWDCPGSPTDTPVNAGSVSIWTISNRIEDRPAPRLAEHRIEPSVGDRDAVSPPSGPMRRNPAPIQADRRRTLELRRIPILTVLLVTELFQKPPHSVN